MELNKKTANPPLSYQNKSSKMGDTQELLKIVNFRINLFVSSSFFSEF